MRSRYDSVSLRDRASLDWSSLISLQHPVLQRLGDVIGADPLGTRKVRNRSRHLEHAIVATRTECEAANRRFEKTCAISVEAACAGWPATRAEPRHRAAVSRAAEPPKGSHQCQARRDARARDGRPSTRTLSDRYKPKRSDRELLHV